MAVSVLHYGCTKWTLTKRIEKKSDGNSIRMLSAVLKETWKQQTMKQQLYSHLPTTSKTIQIRQTRHAGDYWRSKDELISDVLLWNPTHGRARVDRPERIYISSIQVVLVI